MLHLLDRGAPLLIATTNPAKAERLRRCLDGWALDLRKLASLPDREEAPAEVGDSHLAIATAKAIHWSQTAGIPAIASDGGLTIPALGVGWDSLTTKRSAGPDADDDRRIAHLLRVTQGLDGDARRAGWHEAVAIVHGERILGTWLVEGPIGMIAHQPSGTRINGFWAASLWYFPSLGKTYSELSASQLRFVGDPWTRLVEEIQVWLSNQRGLGGRAMVREQESANQDDGSGD
ncbi:MAG: hypothetical protein O3B84_02170 [Chloroflexi bacterium]|nr:hypothetical protein [Chloroflexota bacterium]